MASGSQSAFDGAIEQHALVDTEAEIARHQRNRQRRREVVKLGPVLAADRDQIFEAARGDECGLRAFALEQGVRRDGRSMHDFGALRAV